MQRKTLVVSVPVTLHILVDDIDRDLLDLRWCVKFRYGVPSVYRVTNTKAGRKVQYLHRVIAARHDKLEGKLVVTFKNRNSLDCRRDNLSIMAKKETDHAKLSAAGLVDVSLLETGFSYDAKSVTLKPSSMF
jgi:hypothetical protein